MSTARTQGTSFRLIADPGELAASRENTLEIPQGVTALCSASGEAPQLAPAGAPGAEFLLEPVWQAKQFRLLLVNTGENPVRWNDQIAPRATLLRDGDQISVAGGPTLEVAVFNRPFVGAPPSELIGKSCLLCRVPFIAESRLHRCPCGLGLHLEEGDDDQVLKCAQLTAACPSCQQPIQLDEGYLTIPRILEEDAR